MKIIVLSLISLFLCGSSIKAQTEDEIISQLVDSLDYYNRIGNGEKVLQYVDLLRNDKHVNGLFVMEANGYTYLKQYDKAISILNDSIKSMKDAQIGYSALGAIYELQDNKNKAIEAYEKAAKTFDYPLHLGITESGTLFAGTVKSAAGLGAILSKGIGNTLRISLSADPVEEIKVARELLKSFGLASNMATLISCPTCGRIEIDLISIANEVEEYISKLNVPLKVAVLGCAVNGPGEAREADIGIAGARGEGLLFMKGKTVRKVPEETMVEELKKEIDKLAAEMAQAREEEANANA